MDDRLQAKDNQVRRLSEENKVLDEQLSASQAAYSNSAAPGDSVSQSAATRELQDQLDSLQSDIRALSEERDQL